MEKLLSILVDKIAVQWYSGTIVYVNYITIIIQKSNPIEFVRLVDLHLTTK